MRWYVAVVFFIFFYFLFYIFLLPSSLDAYADTGASKYGSFVLFLFSSFSWRFKKVKIVDEEPPTLTQAEREAEPGKLFQRTKKMGKFVKMCLMKNPKERASAQQLLDHKFLKSHAKDGAYLVEKVYKMLPADYLNTIERNMKEGRYTGPTTTPAGRFTMSGSWDFRDGAPGETGGAYHTRNKPSSLARSEATVREESDSGAVDGAGAASAVTPTAPQKAPPVAVNHPTASPAPSLQPFISTRASSTELLQIPTPDEHAAILAQKAAAAQAAADQAAADAAVAKAAAQAAWVAAVAAPVARTSCAPPMGALSVESTPAVAASHHETRKASISTSPTNTAPPDPLPAVAAAETTAPGAPHIPSPPPTPEDAAAAEAAVATGAGAAVSTAVASGTVKFVLQHYPVKVQKGGVQPVSNSINFDFDRSFDKAIAVAIEMVEADLLAEEDKMDMRKAINKLLKKPELQYVSFQLGADEEDEDRPYFHKVKQGYAQLSITPVDLEKVTVGDPRPHAPPAGAQPEVATAAVPAAPAPATAAVVPAVAPVAPAPVAPVAVASGRSTIDLDEHDAYAPEAVPAVTPATTSPGPAPPAPAATVVEL